MILTDYYRFEKLDNQISKMRIDCIASTGSYPEFECRRATKEQRPTEKRDATNIGDLVVYFGDVPDKFGGNVHRKADKSLSIKSNNLSSVFVPDITNNFGYGDFRSTSDALLFVLQNSKVVNGRIQPGAIIEIFIARGKSKDRVALYNLLCDGELDEEMNALKKQVTKTVTEQG